MRERLIELIRGARKTTKGANCDLEREGLFADYLLANGVIVPPCKVGDTVYFIQSKKIYEGTVILIRPFVHKENTNYHGNVQYECKDPFYNDGRMMTHQISVVFQEFGENTIAFLTREDAEKALKGGEE